LGALGSAIVRALNTDKTSPLFRRFSVPGVPPEPSQNLTIAEAVNGLRRSGLVGKVSGKVLLSGPLSDSTDEKSVRRATSILSKYFECVRSAHPERWEAGRSAYVAVNPGIRAHLALIAEIIDYLSAKNDVDCFTLKESEVASRVIGVAGPVIEFVRDATDEQIKEAFSRKFGEGGVKEYTYFLFRLVRNNRSDFGSEEFVRWIEQSESDRIRAANNSLLTLSENLTNFVIKTLKAIHGTQRLPSGEQAFWEIGIQSLPVRKKAFEKQQQDDEERRRPKEGYLDIVDLEIIVKQKENWPTFEYVFNNPREGDKKNSHYYLGWLAVFNKLRNIAAHKNVVRSYTDEDLEFIDWLNSEVAPKVLEGLRQ